MSAHPITKQKEYLRYRAVWWSEDECQLHSNALTNYQDALGQVIAKRDKEVFAFLEDEFHNRIEGV